MNAGRRTSTLRFRALHWLGLGLLLALAPLHAQVVDGSRIGYVDMQRLIDNAPQMLAARERLRQEFDRQDADLTIEKARLAELDQRIGNAEGEEAQTLQRQSDALRRSIQRTQQRLREDLATRQDQEIDRTWPQINEAIADYAREAGYDIVVQSPVVYYSGRIDITDRVLDQLRRDFARTGGER